MVAALPLQTKRAAAKLSKKTQTLSNLLSILLLELLLSFSFFNFRSLGFFFFVFVIVDVVFVVFPVGCTLKAQAFKVLDNRFEETEGFNFPGYFFFFFFSFLF